MILSFDLDGVISDTDNGLLSLLHQAMREGKPGAANDLLQYYDRRRIVLDPRDFIGVDDTFHIITGRVPTSHVITRAWITRHFGPRYFEQDLSTTRLHLVSDALVEDLFAAGEDTEAIRILAERKIKKVLAIKSLVHFDNNPVIIRAMREAGITAVQIGGSVL